MLYGDTNSCLAVIAAKRQKIPVFHFEAGNRCFDQRVPEELNRKVLDHLSDINLVLTEHARRYLIAEGVRPETIIKTGSHMREVLDYYMPNILKSEVLQRMGLVSEKFFIVSAHREENIDSPQNMANLVETLNELAEQYDIPVIVSTHPRTKKRLDEMELGKLNPHIKFLKPFGFCDYIKLQMEALCVISDSGTISEEASLLNLAAITIRNTHERPEGMDAGTLIMSGLKKDRVLDAVRVIISQHDRTHRVMKPVEDYEVGPVSKQSLRVVLSYVDYVNRTVWSKS
jgi:UDP-N-acetylglucosamine 2-epimerase (non-hydrolysing)